MAVEQCDAVSQCPINFDFNKDSGKIKELHFNKAKYDLKQRQLLRLYEERSSNNVEESYITSSDDCVREDDGITKPTNKLGSEILDFVLFLQLTTSKIWQLMRYAFCFILVVALYLIVLVLIRGAKSSSLQYTNRSSELCLTEVETLDNDVVLRNYAAGALETIFSRSLVVSYYPQSILLLLIFMAAIPTDAQYLKPLGSIGNWSVCTAADAPLPPSLDYCLAVLPSAPSDTYCVLEDSETDHLQEYFALHLENILYQSTYQNFRRSCPVAFFFVSSSVLQYHHHYSGPPHFELMDARVVRRQCTAKLGLAGALVVSLLLVLMSPFCLTVAAIAELCGLPNKISSVRALGKQLVLSKFSDLNVVLKMVHKLSSFSSNLDQQSDWVASSISSYWPFFCMIAHEQSYTVDAESVNYDVTTHQYLDTTEDSLTNPHLQRSINQSLETPNEYSSKHNSATTEDSDECSDATFMATTSQKTTSMEISSYNHKVLLHEASETDGNSSTSFDLQTTASSQETNTAEDSSLKLGINVEDTETADDSSGDSKGLTEAAVNISVPNAETSLQSLRLKMTRKESKTDKLTGNSDKPVNTKRECKDPDIASVNSKLTVTNRKHPKIKDEQVKIYKYAASATKSILPMLKVSNWPRCTVFLVVLMVVIPADASYKKLTESLGNFSICTAAEPPVPPPLDYCLAVPPVSPSDLYCKLPEDSRRKNSQAMVALDKRIILFQLTYKSIRESWTSSSWFVSSLSQYNHPLFSGSSHFELMDASQTRRRVVKLGWVETFVAITMLFMMSPLSLVLIASVNYCVNKIGITSLFKCKQQIHVSRIQANGFVHVVSKTGTLENLLKPSKITAIWNTRAEHRSSLPHCYQDANRVTSSNTSNVGAPDNHEQRKTDRIYKLHLPPEANAIGECLPKQTLPPSVCQLETAAEYVTLSKQKPNPESRLNSTQKSRSVSKSSVLVGPLQGAEQQASLCENGVASSYSEEAGTCEKLSASGMMKVGNGPASLHTLCSPPCQAETNACDEVKSSQNTDTLRKPASTPSLHPSCQAEISSQEKVESLQCSATPNESASPPSALQNSPPYPTETVVHKRVETSLSYEPATSPSYQHDPLCCQAKSSACGEEESSQGSDADPDEPTSSLTLQNSPPCRTELSSLEKVKSSQSYNDPDESTAPLTLQNTPQCHTELTSCEMVKSSQSYDDPDESTSPLTFQSSPPCQTELSSCEKNPDEQASPVTLQSSQSSETSICEEVKSSQSSDTEHEPAFPPPALQNSVRYQTETSAHTWVVSSQSSDVSMNNAEMVTGNSPLHSYSRNVCPPCDQPDSKDDNENNYDCFVREEVDLLLALQTTVSVPANGLMNSMTMSSYTHETSFITSFNCHCGN